MTILFIMLVTVSGVALKERRLIIAKPKQEPVLTSLPIKSFAEIAQTNPYLTGQTKPQ